MRTFARRFVLALAAASLLAACGKGAAGSGADTDASGKFTGSEYAMGNPNAKVTVVEYASVTCPHCAKFDAEVFPQLKSKYVDTGKIRYVFREALIHPELDAAGYMVARCAGKDKYFKVVEAIMRSQQEIFQSGDMRGVLQRIARSAGMSDAQFNACLNDEAALKQMAEREQHTEQVDHITQTPTFLINGKQLDLGAREPAISDFDAAIPPLLAKS